MSSWTRTETDPAILSRISEEEVMAWLASKLEEIRKSTELPIYHTSLDCWFRDYRDGPYYDVAWSLHATGNVCVLSCCSSERAVSEARELILGNPREKAAENRRKAAVLMEEAQELEKLARGHV